MTIIVTGSESFVGMELIAQCKARSIDVWGIDTVAPEVPSYTFTKADIRDHNLRTLFPRSAEAVVHLAALSRDPDCAGKIYECFDINVMGTLNVLEAAKASGTKQFIFASSEWVYPNFVNGEEKDETAHLDAADLHSEYAISKLVGEGALRIDHERSKLPTTILRFGIIYGPRASNWSAVESLASKVARGERIEVGSLMTGRRFVHVSDIARGILASLGRTQCETFNLTADSLITLQDIVAESEEVFSTKAQVTQSAPNNPNVRNPSNRKAKKELGWTPTIDLRSGIESLRPFLA